MVETSQLVMGAAVVVVIALVAAANRMMSKANPLGEGQAAGDDDGHSVDPMLCKFVAHEGNTVGETVAFDGERMILKDHGVFMAVDRSLATLDGETVVIQGYVDWDAAKEAGASWRAANTKGLDPAVTGELTRSEDVVAPAREATRDRDDDEEE